MVIPRLQEVLEVAVQALQRVRVQSFGLVGGAYGLDPDPCHELTPGLIEKIKDVVQKPDRLSTFPPVAADVASKATAFHLGQYSIEPMFAGDEVGEEPSLELKVLGCDVGESVFRKKNGSLEKNRLDIRVVSRQCACASGLIQVCNPHSVAKSNYSHPSGWL